MQEQALKIASQITHSVTVAAFASVLAATAFAFVYRAKKPKLAGMLAAGLIILGLAPLCASTYLQSRGLYRVRVVVLGLDGLPVEDARVSSSSGGEPKKVEGGWEFDIPPQTRPADRTVSFFASVKSAFLTGRSSIAFGEDYYPMTHIQLAPDTSAVLRGAVLDEHGRPVAGATVSVVGYTESTITDGMGNFSLPAHAADGQVVQVRAQKDRLVGAISVPAGRTPVQITIKRP